MYARTVFKYKGDYVVRIPKLLLQKLNLKVGDPIEVNRLDSESLIVSPIKLASHTSKV